MKQQQDDKRDPNQTNPQGQQAQDQDGQSGTKRGGRQDQSNPDRSLDQPEDQQPPEGQGRPRNPGSATSEPGEGQDSDSAGIGKESQGGQSQRTKNPSRER